VLQCYNLSHHHNLAHSSHAEPPEAAVCGRGAGARAGQGGGLRQRAHSINREQKKKKKLKESVDAAKQAATFA